MPIPQFKYTILPFLRNLSDGKEHTLRETEDVLASQFKLTEAELSQMVPSGRQEIFRNRVGWAKTYLKKAGLIDAPKRGLFKITEQGQRVLAEKPKIIDLDFLDKFPSFHEFRYGNEEGSSPEKTEILESTPEETMEAGYQGIIKDLHAELLNNIQNSSPRFFERLVVELLLAMGYGGSRKDAGQAVGQSGDGGIDGIIKEDKLGLDVIYLQAKRWENVVGSKEIRNFVGSLVGQKASKGVFITTSRFTKDALEYVRTINHKVILIDGEMLAQLMTEYGIGVSKVISYNIKKIDSDYFTEE